MRIASVASAFPEHYYDQQVLTEALKNDWRHRLPNPDILDRLDAVSYTHLDVYKRQTRCCGRGAPFCRCFTAARPRGSAVIGLPIRKRLSYCRHPRYPCTLAFFKTARFWIFSGSSARRRPSWAAIRCARGFSSSSFASGYSGSNLFRIRLDGVEVRLCAREPSRSDGQREATRRRSLQRLRNGCACRCADPSCRLCIPAGSSPRPSKFLLRCRRGGSVNTSSPPRPLPEDKKFE